MSSNVKCMMWKSPYAVHFIPYASDLLKDYIENWVFLPPHPRNTVFLFRVGRSISMCWAGCIQGGSVFVVSRSLSSLKVNALLPTDTFIMVVRGLMGNQLPSVRRKAMELLNNRLQQRTRWEEQQVHTYINFLAFRAVNSYSVTALSWSEPHSFFSFFFKSIFIKMLKCIHFVDN